jgi:hypothetical protein
VRAPPSLPQWGECSFKQSIGADDIRGDELGRSVDGTIDVALGGQMHDGIGIEVGEELGDLRAIADIRAAEMVVRVSLNAVRSGY